MSGDESLLNQEELDRLLNAKSAAGPSSSGTSPVLDPGTSPTTEPVPNPPGQSTAARAAPPVASGVPNPKSSGAADLQDADRKLKQDDIDRLLEQAGVGAGKPAPAKSAGSASPPPQESIAPADIEYLFEQAQRALESVEEAPSTSPRVLSGLRRYELEEFGGAPPSGEAATLELISDVELEVQIELGRTRMYLEDVLKLRKGSVVALEKLAGDPVDIYVNGRLVARGEVLVLNDNFCVRVGELIAPHQRG